jgi:arginase family enzyme
LRALEGGVVVSPRYDRGDWQEGDGVFNAAALASYTCKLADRIEHHVRAGDFPLVLGGDCSINLGAAPALRRIGRYGLAVVDASLGAETLASVTRQAFEIPQVDGFWVHLDADVLDPSVMPAVDSPEPEGLTPDELVALLRPLLASAHCVGLNVTIYDPDLDPEGTAGALLTDVIVSAFDQP